MARCCKRIKSIFWTRIVDSDLSPSDLELFCEQKLSRLETNHLDHMISEWFESNPDNLLFL